MQQLKTVIVLLLALELKTAQSTAYFVHPTASTYCSYSVPSLPSTCSAAATYLGIDYGGTINVAADPANCFLDTSSTPNRVYYNSGGDYSPTFNANQFFICIPTPAPPTPAPPPPRTDCKFTWGAWSACSVDCGMGVKTRSAIITALPVMDGFPCPDDEKEECEVKTCAPPPVCEARGNIKGKVVHKKERKDKYCTKKCNNIKKCRTHREIKKCGKCVDGCACAGAKNSKKLIKKKKGDKTHHKEGYETTADYANGPVRLLQEKDVKPEQAFTIV